MTTQDAAVTAAAEAACDGSHGWTQPCALCVEFAERAVPKVRPIIEAEVRDSIRRRYETNTCACGHDRTAHHSWDLGDCADCPHGTCVAPYNEGLLWDRRHGLRDEAEVRERIAAEIEAEFVGQDHHEPTFNSGRDAGLRLAARIARGQS